ncbi:Protein cornichon 4 [Folsomia candida]|uniref:Protein cornichon 4 n=1 Tax=Folsomia candida TaxID=158441 RepID=A0A226ENQ6_FOLCA|nr:Protein cornichon 4 [Folsomia candida]
MIFNETILFIVSMILTGVLLFLFVYYIITLSDLECDYINAQQCCHRLNMVIEKVKRFLGSSQLYYKLNLWLKWNIPAVVGQGIVTVCFLLHGWFLLFTLNLPMASWSSYQVLKIPSGNLGLYDPMEIHNRGQLKNHMRDVLIKMAFHLVAFFVYLYCMIVSMLKTDPIPGSQPSGEFDEF